LREFEGKGTNHVFLKMISWLR